jgi:hypothetical protein
LDFLFLDTLAPLRLNGPYFVPRGPPAFALFAILLFHSRAKSADSESSLQAVCGSSISSGPAAKAELTPNLSRHG